MVTGWFLSSSASQSCLVSAWMTASKVTPSSSSTASWSRLMPSRRMTAMLRALGLSVTEMTRGAPLSWKAIRSQARAASVA